MKDIILIATEEEAPTMATWDNVIITGIGKVNAAYKTTQMLYEHEPERVWNFGTAGAVKPGISGLCVVSHVSQYDMDCSALGMQLGFTPGEMLREYDMFERNLGTWCGTADQFTDEYNGIQGVEIVDMEAYAIVKCIRNFYKDTGIEIPFYCYKYVSNSVCAGGGDDWQQNISAGEQYYMEAYERKRKQMQVV